MKLVLAEKPSVAQSLAKVLGANKRCDGYLEGNGYVVSWCVGHLVELSQPEAYNETYAKWRLEDLPILPTAWKYQVYGINKRGIKGGRANMAGRVAGKIKLQTVDELLGVPEIAGTQEIELGRIHAFPNHPFKVLDDERMDMLVESIRENGILNPVIVRPDKNGDYEMISGHRRLHAAGIVGLSKIPAIVKEMSDDEAIIKMVDANIQREEIMPSEKAFAYKMKLEAMKRTAGRPTKENACHNGTHLRSDQELALQVGDSARSIQRYIRLTELIPELLECIDNKKLGLVIAVDLSYLDVQVQKWVYEYFKENGFLKPVQVEALKNHSNLSNASQHMIITILNEALPKKSTAAKVSLSEKKLDKYFPPHYSAKDRENVIIQLLEQWSTQQAQE